MLLSHLLSAMIRHGHLSVIDARGRIAVFGSGERPAVTIRLHDPNLDWRLALEPELAIGEAYTSGALTIEQGTVYAFLELLARNGAETEAQRHGGPLDAMRRTIQRLAAFNPMAKARENAEYHYSLSEDFYQLFLDSDCQYSCGYFASPADDLERAQERKKRHIAAKLLLKPGQRVLDIGCGWGGLALYLARRFGVAVTGITLSERQCKIATARAAALQPTPPCRFFLRDYREEIGPYERIVSVGMFEHVGTRHYDEFFRIVRTALRPDGLALIHTIGRTCTAGSTNPWIERYIFPGGYVPALSEVSAAIERSGLWITDVEVLRLHYAQTLRHWRQRLEAARATACSRFGAPFYRMWEFYLAGSEIAFRFGRLVVFQIQLARARDTAPLTRDYMLKDERALERADMTASLTSAA